MPKLPQSLATLPNQAATALRQAAAWIEHHRLKIKHAKTLARFNNLHYTDIDNTISVFDAFNQGLLEPHAWLSPLLVTQVDKLTNKKVLERWNQATLAAVRASSDGKHPPGGIPLNNILRNAAYTGDTETLQWLMDLKQPSQKLEWTPDLLLLHDLKTAHWAMMWHEDCLQTDEPHRFVQESLSPQGFISSRWLTHRDEPNTNYSSALRHMDDIKHHVHNVVSLYFKDMPWQERWSTFIDSNVAPSTVGPTTYHVGMQGLVQGYVFIAGVLNNAPMDVQKCLAAFKNSRHPKEDPSLSYDVEPKAIRHAFFGGPAPKGPVPAPLETWLALMQGTPKEEAGNAWVEWHTHGYTMTADMNVPLPESVFGVQGAP